MKRVAGLVLFLFCLTGVALAQAESSRQTAPPVDDNPDDILNSPMTPPRSDKPARAPSDSDDRSYSSSNDSRGDISPPPDDASHPGGDINIEPSPGVGETDGVMEMKPWDPHVADKDVEVGIFYYKRSNYKAAEARFRDALHWQDNHAEAIYRLAQTLEKEGKNPEAQKYYRAYLKILPQGEFAGDSKKALDRLIEKTAKK
ncbi:MAG TPA: tetratricopeptide repeat protein [Terriglobales bacterium]|nr:tetratricopeptide repeat protein [Terriglobales bacterium]